MNDSDEKLDSLLRSWSQNHSVSEKHLNVLIRQVVDNTVSANNASVQLKAPYRADRRLIFACFAVAASLLLGTVIWFKLGDGNADQLAEKLPSDKGAWLELVGRQSQLLNEYQNLFGDEVAWIAESEQLSDVGLRTRSSAEKSSESRYLVIRLRVQARQTTGGDWNDVQFVNLLVEEQQLVQIPAMASLAGPLTLWTYPLGDNLVAVDLECHFESESRGSIESDSILHLGDSVRVGTFKRDGVEYRLDQTIDFVTRDDVG
jgi:hypothetical protein